MKWLRIPLVAVLLIPLAAHDRPEWSPIPVDPIKACVYLTADPLSGRCIAQVEVGIGSTVAAQAVVMYADMGKRLCCVDGDVEAPGATVPLPWRSLPRQTAFKVPDTDDNDLRVVLGVRVGPVASASYFWGEEYFALTGVRRDWKCRPVQLRPTTTADEVGDIISAESAITARATLELSSKQLAESRRDPQQPRFGPATGLRLKFVPPPGPTAGLQVSFDRISIRGPTHGFEPMRVWMWIVPSTNGASNVGCNNIPPLTISTAFCDCTNPPWSIQVPSDLDMTTFNQANMKLPASPNFCVVGIISERDTTNGSILCRFHYSDPIPTNQAPNSAIDIPILTMCMQANAPIPSP